jgi:phage shock protein B
MDPEYIIGLVAVVSIFVILPGMVFHYITAWRRQKTLQPDDERMLEDLWRSARSIERRLETMEALLDDDSEEEDTPPRRRPRTSDRFED